MVMLLGLASPVATNPKPRWKFQPSRGRLCALPAELVHQVVSLEVVEMQLQPELWLTAEGM